jgi:hypothetical protein
VSDQSVEMIREHRQQISNLFGRVNGLENSMASTLEWKDRVDMDLYNHGQDGMKTQLTKFMTDHAVRENERDKRDKRLNTRLAIIGAIATVLTLILAYKTYIDTVYHVRNGDIKIPYFSFYAPRENAYTQQYSAGAQFTRR